MESTWADEFLSFVEGMIREGPKTSARNLRGFEERLSEYNNFSRVME